MKLLGIILLVVGFLWITFDVAGGFTRYQYSRWVWQSQQLPEAETIKRTDAVSAMRALSLDLRDRHRVFLIPAALMLAGGLVALFGPSKQKIETHTA